MIETASLLRNKLINSYPTNEQMLKINSLRPSTVPELSADELIIIPAIASSNLIHADYQKWTPSTIESMVVSYNQGKSYTESHNWRDLQLIKGIVFESELWEYKSPHSKLISYVLRESQNKMYDEQIIQAEGLLLAIIYIAIEKNNKIYDDLRFIRRFELSVGGWLHKQNHYCPLCSSSIEKILFQDERCPHIMPDMWLTYFWNQLSSETQALIAPYIIMEGEFEMEEVSNVMSKGNLQARIISSELVNLLT